jgi:hypothetical protein
MRRYFIFILLISLAIFTGHTASAYVSVLQRATLIDQYVFPDCLRAQAGDWEGPVLLVTNNCKAPAVITDIKVTPAKNDNYIGVNITDENKLINSRAPRTIKKSFLFAGRSSNCKAAYEYAEQLFKADQQKTDIYNNQNKIVANNPKLKIPPPKKSDVVCDSFSIPVDSSLMASIPVKSDYMVSGYIRNTEDSKDSQLMVSGKMRDPWAPNPPVGGK